MRSLAGIDELEAFPASAPMTLLLCSAPHCGVCHAVAPKLETLVADRFPGLAMAEIDIEVHPESRGLLSVFTAPVLIAYAQGKELFRMARVFGIEEVSGRLARSYGLLYGD